MPNRLFEVAINQGGKNLRRCLPAKGEHIFGRDSACAIAIEDAQVSRQHVRLAFYLDPSFVEDPRSANGTFVDGKCIEHAVTVADHQQVLTDYPKEIGVEAAQRGFCDTVNASSGSPFIVKALSSRRGSIRMKPTGIWPTLSTR